MNRKRLLSLLLNGGALALTLVFFLGCELDSAESVTRNVGIDFSGFYDSTSTNSDFVSPANSGARVTSFNLRQSGDLLEAIDNNGIVFRGNIGAVDGTTASFTLGGSTTVGNEVTITGTLAGDAAAETATMKGTWIEPGLYAAILGDAKINPIQTNSPGPVTNELKLATSKTVLQSSESANLTASGGTTPYTWSASVNNLGTLSVSPSGNTAEYQANSTIGTNTITVTDASSQTASQTITQTGP